MEHTLLSWHRCLRGMGVEMELRHLRYFVAIAEAGSLTEAAARKLHTSQPSLSRQIRDLEDEVGAQLLMRTARGIELTPAGRAFLDHARSVLSISPLFRSNAYALGAALRISTKRSAIILSSPSFNCQTANPKVFGSLGRP